MKVPTVYIMRGLLLAAACLTAAAPSSLQPQLVQQPHAWDRLLYPNGAWVRAIQFHNTLSVRLAELIAEDERADEEKRAPAFVVAPRPHQAFSAAHKRQYMMRVVVLLNVSHLPKDTCVTVSFVRSRQARIPIAFRAANLCGDALFNAPSIHMEMNIQIPRAPDDGQPMIRVRFSSDGVSTVNIPIHEVLLPPHGICPRDVALPAIHHGTTVQCDLPYLNRYEPLFQVSPIVHHIAHRCMKRLICWLCPYCLWLAVHSLKVHGLWPMACVA